VVESVVPLDGLLLESVVLPGSERGLVVVVLPLRGVAGPDRPSGELLPTPVLLPGVVAPLLP
jgi:hypothetical protein